MTRRIFKNARLLDPASGLDAMGAVLVEDGVIGEVGPGVFVDAVQEDVAVVDCRGRCLAPGLVDMRVETGEPGDDHLETLTTASQAAVAGGVTTMVVLPSTRPPIDDVSVLEYVERRGAEVGLVNVHCYGAATKGLAGREMAELGLMAEAGAVGFTDAGRAIADALVLRRILAYATVLDRIVVQHPEVPELAAEGVANEGEIATRLGLSGIPAAAEVMMVERDLRLVALTGGRWHGSRISTAAAIEAIRKAKAAGLRVTCDTAPHYFALNEQALFDYRTFAKVSPPLRSEEDRRAVVEGLADGTIDAIASDHTPRDQDSKRVPFAQADAGIIGLETLLPLTLELVHKGELTMMQALAALTARPAAILGLEAGTLRKGAPADLMVFDPSVAHRINVATFRSKSKNSPFDGRPVQGRVVRTVRAGRVVHDAETAETPGARARLATA